MQFKGTRWYKTDLHLHTPASKCFKDQEVTPEQWVERCIEQGLSVVAVTDHNTGAYIDIIKEAAKNTELTVFPGVEVTCSESKVHMLVIFDKEKTTQDIEDFLSSIDIDRESFATAEAYSPKPTIEIAKKVEEKGGIIIPAHIDEYNGICEISYHSREDLLKLSHINAVQVVHEIFLQSNAKKEIIDSTLAAYYKRTINEDRYRDWKVSVQRALEHNKSILTFSDNPDGPGESKHGLWGIGKRYTWIKMDENITLESLRQALLLPEHRVRNDFTDKVHPYSFPDFWMKSIKISNTELNHGELELDFNPQMTTIIGGRGTGKSSILRFIRGLFNKINDLEGLANLAEEQKKFFKIKQNEEGVLKKDSIIEIIVVRFGQEYKVTLTTFNQNGPQNIVISKFDKDKKIFNEVKEENLLDLFKSDIFSQKQIYEIAQKPNALRERIDNSMKDTATLENELSSIKSEYFEKSAKIRGMKNEIKRKSKLIAEIKDKKEQISSFKESGFEDLVKDYKSYNTQFASLKIINDQLSEKEAVLSSILEKIKFKEEPNIDGISATYREEISNVIDTTLNDYMKIESLVEDAYTRVIKLGLEYREKLNNTEWTSQYNEIRKNFTRKKEDLIQKGIEDLSKVEIITQELTVLEEDLKRISRLETLLDTEKAERENLKKKFIFKRKEVTKRRREFINEVINEKDNVKIEVKPFRDKQSFIESLRRIIQKNSGFEDDIKKMTNMCFHDGDVLKNVANLVKQLHEIRKDSLNIELDLGGRMNNVIKGLNEEQLDELTLLIPEDEIAVKYKPNGSSIYKSLTNASAGQKTSAILTFLLSFGEVPLLLDQPEDDLDNHLIYDLIVERLKQTKEKRQIIVVTHNANIPVNGDSEWIICMDSEVDGIKLLCDGPVEGSIIKKEICDVMEGGEEAFKMRARRYNIN